MKKLITICLLLATVFTVNAQDGKPTKEQTVQFIKDYFNESIPQCSVDLDGKYVSMRRINNIKTEFNLDNCIMTFYYEYELLVAEMNGTIRKNDIFYHKMIIDFNTIESISLFDKPFKGCSIVHAVLKTSSGKTIDTYEAGGYTKNKDFSSIPSKEKEASIPINSYDCDGCNHNETNKKIIQAFNHLRKLCGAPEPINFDGN